MLAVLAFFCACVIGPNSLAAPVCVASGISLLTDLHRPRPEYGMEKSFYFGRFLLQNPRLPMKIFVGYGYNAADGWIKELVFPLIEAFGDEPIDGKEIYGQALDEGVRTLIRDCDALIGFLTRRDGPNAQGLWTTHRWVTDEIATADAQKPKIPFVEVREADVDPQLGIAVGKAHIKYDPKERDRCLLAIAQTVSRWHKDLQVCELQLIPEQFIKSVASRLGDGNLRCSYQLMNALTGKESAEFPANIVRRKEGLFIYADSVPPGRFIRIRVSYGQKFLWLSEYQKPDTRHVSLQKQKLV